MVADAASLPLEWIYKDATMKVNTGRGTNEESQFDRKLLGRRIQSSGLKASALSTPYLQATSAAMEMNW